MIKVVVVVLVVMVVLFVGLAVWGNSKNASEPKPDKNSFDPTKHSKLKSFDAILHPFAPKLDLAKKTFDLSNVIPGASVAVTIPKDKSHHKFRIAKFHLAQSGCAKMEYVALGSDDGTGLGDQKWPDNNPNGKKVDLTQVSFTILELGGTLTLTHNAFPQACVVQLE